jgi:hypothetical protein
MRQLFDKGSRFVQNVISSRLAPGVDLLEPGLLDVAVDVVLGLLLGLEGPLNPLPVSGSRNPLAMTGPAA